MPAPEAAPVAHAPEPANQLRIGLRAVALDAVCAAGAAAGAASTALPLPAALVLVAAALGLYRPRGQATWPVRLCAAGALTATLASALTLVQGFAAPEPALVVRVVVTAVVLAAAWRVVNGTIYRRQRRAHRARTGPGELVPQGDALSSMSEGLRRVWDYRHLVRNLVAQHLELRYRGLIVGVVWTLVVPLLMVVVYTTAFSRVIVVGTPRLGLYLLVGLLAWNYFSGVLRASTDAVVGATTLLRSVAFPRLALPLALVLFHLAQFLLALAVFLPVGLWIYGVPSAAGLAAFPVFLALHTVFIVGVAFGLATITALVRDVRHLVDASLPMLFWATPVVYEMKLVPASIATLVNLSPVAAYIRAYQDIFYYGVVPEPALWVAAVLYAAGALACGVSVFQAHEARFAELV